MAGDRGEIQDGTKGKKKRISTSSAKAKGRAFQQWVCSKISEVTGFPHGKDCPIESRPMGQSGVDVRLEKAVLNYFPFSVECKRQESWSVHSWIEQAKQNIIPGTDWLLFCKSSRKEAVVIMDAGVFFKLLSKKEAR